MTNTEKGIQKSIYAYIESVFWEKISSDVFWYFLEYQSPTFTPNIIASIFSDVMKNNAFKLAEEIENDCDY